MKLRNIASICDEMFRLLTKEIRCHACTRPFIPYEKHSGIMGSHIFCPECSNLLVAREKGFCPLCGELSPWEDLEPSLCGTCIQSPPPWQSFLFYGKYDNVLQDLILRLKFHNNILSAYSLGVLLANYPKLVEKLRQVDCIVPIPLHPRRIEERGYNQALEIAKQLLRCTEQNLSLFPHGLVRSKETVPQLLLNRSERKQNQRGTFNASKDLSGLRVLVLDDVITTGATLEAATLALHDVGVDSVHIFAVARTASF